MIEGTGGFGICTACLEHARDIGAGVIACYCTHRQSGAWRPLGDHWRIRHPISPGEFWATVIEQAGKGVAASKRAKAR
jgi:hypothetical protein